MMWIKVVRVVVFLFITVGKKINKNIYYKGVVNLLISRRKTVSPSPVFHHSSLEENARRDLFCRRKTGKEIVSSFFDNAYAR